MSVNKIEFEYKSDFPHQVAAVNSVRDVFKGVLRSDEATYYLSDEVITNMPAHMDFDESFLLGNLQDIQISNGITPQSHNLEYNLKSTTLNLEKYGSHHYPTYTVEMETGTGKTYVYLKSIFELNKSYGFTKFVLVVPSIAIFEGAVKTIEETIGHFRTEYGKTINPYFLKGKNVSSLKNYAIDTGISLLVLTIDSFNKKNNQVYKSSDKLVGSGLLPIEFVQKTRPVLMLDESQNYRSEISQKALNTLMPLAAFNFSATPGDKPNLIYYLSPVEALKNNLVKRIQVLGISDEDDSSSSLGEKGIYLEDVYKTSSGDINAKLKVYKISSGIKKKTSLLIKKVDTDLFAKTNNPEHKGIVVSNMKLRPKCIEFQDGEVLTLDSSQNHENGKDEIFRLQIRETIRFHFEKQKELEPSGIKVLSLFFIDRVMNYVPEQSKLKKIFDEEFNKVKQSSVFFKAFKASEVRDGYFSFANYKNKLEYLDELNDEYDKKTLTKLRKLQKEAQKKSYELIMKGKKELLSFENKVSFIFAHSSLKEGWDNPNVFQICTLRDTPSDDTKRQIVGRGMRICVNQDGKRYYDEESNILTIIANQSYKSFCLELQKEYAKNGDIIPVQPRNAKRSKAKRNEDIIKLKDFQDFWKKLTYASSYSININTEKLISECATYFKMQKNRPEKRKVSISFGEFTITRISIRLISVNGKKAVLVITKKNTLKGIEKVECDVREGDNLELQLKELNGYNINSILDRGESSTIEFTNGHTLSYTKRIKFHVNVSDLGDVRDVAMEFSINKTVDVVSRVQDATNLTRRTIRLIYKGLPEEMKNFYKENSEGFTNIFVKGIKECLDTHIANNIEYSINSDENVYDIMEMFPPEISYVQKEVVTGSENALYDQIQVDSDVEKRFVNDRLVKDDGDGNIITYFKFPPKFKVFLPKVIGNYNPDWGILRKVGDEKVTVELVRETKGSEDISKLQRTSEGHKIKCAEKYFSKLDINYRHVTDKTTDWMD